MTRGIYMFNSIQFVRDLCKERNIPIAKLEKDCGFSNGYLNPKKMSKLPYDRAVIIASYLSVSAEYLLTGEDNKEAPTDSGERVLTDAELKFALFGDCEDVSDDDLADVRRYAAFVRERKKDKK